LKRSKQITLLCLTTIIAGFLAGCGEERINHLRKKRYPTGAVMRDKDGNPLYEDDDGQNYTYYGGQYYPWYTRANGYSTIPGSGVTAPSVGGGVSGESISRSGSSASTSRGGFGNAGVAAHAGGSGGAE
jgi:hypothetical protein